MHSANLLVQNRPLAILNDDNQLIIWKRRERRQSFISSYYEQRKYFGRTVFTCLVRCEFQIWLDIRHPGWTMMTGSRSLQLEEYSIGWHRINDDETSCSALKWRDLGCQYFSGHVNQISRQDSPSPHRRLSIRPLSPTQIQAFDTEECDDAAIELGIQLP